MLNAPRWRIARRRLARRRVVAAATALLALTVVTAAGLESKASATVSVTVGSNWRGAYDLLVLPSTTVPDSAGATAGLIEQNFASLSSGERISAQALAAIAQLPDVGVAAPLAYVGSLASPSYGLLVGANEPSGADSEFFARSTAYDIEATVVLDDGISTRDVSTSRATLLVDMTGPVPAALAWSDGTSQDASVLTGGDGRWMVDTTLATVPELSAGLIAVDPVAESELLGDARGFLAPLLEAAEARSPSDLAALVDPVLHEYEHHAVTNGYTDGPVVPVVVAAGAYPKLDARVRVTPLDVSRIDSRDVDPDTGAELADAPRGAPVESVVDLTKRLTPFSLPTLAVRLPGASEAPGGTAIRTTPSLVPTVVGRPHPEPPTGAQSSTAPGGVASSLVLQPQGFANLGDSAEEQTYREARPTDAVIPGEVLYAPVGTYAPADLASFSQGASYVPLGTYAQSSIRVPGRDGGPEVVLAPSFSGRGAALASPGAVTTTKAAAELVGSADVDVVRVRVAGVDEYSAEALAKIGSVAAEITALGLDVRVVAGSSLAPVALYLPEFTRGADLGWTVEEWTSLGAAVQVEEASVRASSALLLASLGGVTLLAAFTILAGAAGRRDEAALLETSGWSRRRIRTWFLGEDLPALVMVVGAGFVAASIATDGAALVAIVVAVMVTALAFLVTANPLMLPVRRARTAPPRQRVPARAPSRVGVRIARAHPGASFLGAAAVVVVSVVLVVGSVLVADARADAGVTRLAVLVADRVRLAQMLLLATATVAGASLFVLGVRGMLRSSDVPRRLLGASGWDRRPIVRTATSQIAAALGPGLVVAAVLGIFVGGGTSGLPVVLAASVPVVLLVVAVLWAAVHARRRTQGVFS